MTRRRFFVPVLSLVVACLAVGGWPPPAAETRAATAAVTSPVGVAETTYSDGWERDDPITIASFEEGECCCPTLRRLPGGDLVVGVGRGGDIHFANNAGDHAAWFRSRDNGRTWAPDPEFRPPYEKLFIRGDVVRCYDQYSFAIKGRSPSRYICRYAESTDGGRTFLKHGISTYDTLGHPEGDSPYRAGQLAGGMHGKPNPGPWREILDEAGWKGDDWVNAPVGGITSDGLDHHGWLEMPDGSLLTCHSSAKRADGRSGNTLVSRSTDGGISWQFVSRVNPETYERVEGYNEASPMLHRDPNHKDGRLTVIMRCGGGGFPLVQAHSTDGGRTWTPPEDLHPHSPCVRPSQIRLRDGALAVVHGRPGMFVCFDPVGDSRHWEFNGKHDLWDRETLTLKTQAKPTTDRKDLKKYMDTIYGLTREDLSWARPELVDGFMSGWENLAIEELPTGELLIVYDVQNLIEKPEAPPRKAIRAVRMRRKEAKQAAAVEVKLGERQVLFVAPDNEQTRRWGVYGCPDMYRAEDGSIVVSDGGHMDTYDPKETTCPAVSFRSTDDGRSWQPVAQPESGKVFRLADGGQVQFVPKGPPVDLAALGVAPRGLVMSPNEYALFGLYRLADIPRESRLFTVRYRPANAAAWQKNDGIFDLPDQQIATAVKAKKGVANWSDVTPTFAPLWYGLTGLHDGATGEGGLVEAADGAWLSATLHAGGSKRNAECVYELRCIASTDQGKTWRPRGVIIGRAGTRFGATEEFSMIRLGGEIICVDRMDLATTHDPHRSTMLARSTDNGLTWSEPEKVASSSVTPHLVKLENGVVALVYGRPGVHVQFSSDGCRSWQSRTSLIGKTAEEEVAAGRNLIDAMYGDTVSYSNTRTVVTGPDRFLVLYTDFKHGAEKRKAIVVQQVVATRKP